MLSRTAESFHLVYGALHNSADFGRTRPHRFYRYTYNLEFLILISAGLSSVTFGSVLSAQFHPVRSYLLTITYRPSILIGISSTMTMMLVVYFLHMFRVERGIGVGSEKTEKLNEGQIKVTSTWAENWNSSPSAEQKRLQATRNTKNA